MASAKTFMRWRTGLSLLFAAAMVVYFLTVEWQIHQYLETALAWPVSVGHITDALARKNCSKDTRFTPVLVYSYDAAGITHSGNEVRFKDLPCNDELATKLILGKFPVGMPIMVHVNPQKLEESLVFLD